MPNALDAIRATLRKTQLTTEQLDVAATSAARVDDQARAEVERLVAKVQAGFIDPEATRAADRAALAAARESAGDASDLLAEIRKRHAASVEADEQARRRQLYDSARARAEEAAADLARAYPAVVKSALKMLRSLAEAQRDVQIANAQLPAGLPAIDDPEHMVRGRPYRPMEIVSETEVVLWTRHDMATPVDEPFQSQIYEAAQGWGQHPNHEEPNYLQVRYLRREIRQPVYGSTPAPLAVALRLPALQSEGLAWGSPDVEGAVSPTVMAAMAGHAYPDVVLGKMHEMDAAPSAKAKADEPEIKVEWDMLGYVGPVPLKPGMNSYHAAEDENPNRLSDHDPRPIGSELVGLPGQSIPGTGVPLRPRFGDSPYSDDARR